MHQHTEGFIITNSDAALKGGYERALRDKTREACVSLGRYCDREPENPAIFWRARFEEVEKRLEEVSSGYRQVTERAAAAIRELRELKVTLFARDAHIENLTAEIAELTAKSTTKATFGPQPRKIITT